MKITERQIEIISHSLGVNWYNAKVSDRPKDKILPDEFYRNYFFTSEGGKDFNDLEYLHSVGYCSKSKGNTGYYYYMNYDCIDFFRKEFNSKISSNYKKSSKSKMNYINYIEFDTDWSFSDYLGIVLPELEQCYRRGYRIVSNKYYNVKGEWSKNITNAKKSYKTNLNEFLKRPDRKDFIIK